MAIMLRFLDLPQPPSTKYVPVIIKTRASKALMVGISCKNIIPNIRATTGLYELIGASVDNSPMERAFMMKSSRELREIPLLKPEAECLMIPDEETILRQDLAPDTCKSL